MQRQQRGITLIETVLAASIVAITAGAVLPPFTASVERRHLEGAAAQLETDVQFARSLAVAGNRTVHLTVRAGCYFIHDGSAADSTCADPQTRTAHLHAARLGATATSASMSFDPAKGTVTPTSSIELRSAGGQAVRVVVNVMGRVRSCSPTGLSGYKPC